MSKGLIRLAGRGRVGPGTLFGSVLLMLSCRLRRVALDGVVTTTRRMPKLETGGEVRLGRRCSFRNVRMASLIGAERGGVMELGEYTFVNEGATIVASLDIKIGKYCRIGEFVGIFDTNYHSVARGESAQSAAVWIGDNVWIGRAALILPGVSVGENSVIAAHGVVTHDVPPNCVVAGNPARVIRSIPESGSWHRD